MRFLSHMRIAFRIIKSAVKTAKKVFACLADGSIQVGIINGRFIYENNSDGKNTKIDILLGPVFSQPVLVNA